MATSKLRWTGYKWVEDWQTTMDYSQLEARIMATCSLDCTCDADRKPNQRREAVMATRAKHGSR
jgi:hypothetical protein